MSETIHLVPHMSSWNGQEQIYLSYILKLDVQLQAKVSFYGHCTHFVFLESRLWISSKYGDGDDNEQQEEDRIYEDNYF